MYIHITHRENLESIKSKGLLTAQEANKPVCNSDKNKISTFYFLKKPGKDILEEAIDIVHAGKSVHPLYKNQLNSDYIILEINDPKITWEFFRKPVEIYPPFYPLSKRFDEHIYGYAKTTQKIPVETIKVVEI